MNKEFLVKKLVNERYGYYTGVYSRGMVQWNSNRRFALPCSEGAAKFLAESLVAELEEVNPPYE